MPAVHFTVAWPDGSRSQGYSPSTVIHQYLDTTHDYTLEDFMQRLRIALNEASERVYQLKGFYCSAAMDTLNQLEHVAKLQSHGTVRLLQMQ